MSTNVSGAPLRNSQTTAETLNRNKKRFLSAEERNKVEALNLNGSFFFIASPKMVDKDFSTECCSASSKAQSKKLKTLRAWCYSESVKRESLPEWSLSGGNLTTYFAVLCLCRLFSSSNVLQDLDQTTQGFRVLSKLVVFGFGASGAIKMINAYALILYWRTMSSLNVACSSGMRFVSNTALY